MAITHHRRMGLALLMAAVPVLVGVGIASADPPWTPPTPTPRDPFIGEFYEPAPPPRDPTDKWQDPWFSIPGYPSDPSGFDIQNGHLGARAGRSEA